MRMTTQCTSLRDQLIDNITFAGFETVRQKLIGLGFDNNKISVTFTMGADLEFALKIVSTGPKRIAKVQGFELDKCVQIAMQIDDEDWKNLKLDPNVTFQLEYK